MRTTILILFFLPLILVAQNNGDTLVTKKSLVEIQNKVSELEAKVNDGKSTLANANTMIDISSRYSNTADNLIKNWLTCLAIIISITGITGILGFTSYFKNKKDELLLSMKYETNLRLAEILKDKEETISKLIEKHEIEKGLISNSKILIINKEGTKLNKYLEKVLKKFSKKIEVEDVPDLLIHEFKNKFKDFDLVLFDNTNTLKQTNNWDFRQNKPSDEESDEMKETILKQNIINKKLKDKLVEIAENVCNANVVFLFFGNNDDHFADKLPKYAHLINFSNSASTAYSNIINLLNFRILLKKSI